MNCDNRWTNWMNCDNRWMNCDTTQPRTHTRTLAQSHAAYLTSNMMINFAEHELHTWPLDALPEPLANIHVIE